MVRLLIVDDSTFMRKALKRMVTEDPEIEVVGEAGDGREAMEKVMSLKPDVVTMDLIMPGVDGLWALEEIMKQRPTPVVIVSSVATKMAEVTKEAFTLGVVDVLTKPDNPQNIAIIQREFIETIKAASKVSRMRLLEYKSAYVKEKTTETMIAHQAVVIATSAGGPTSLYEVIPRLSNNFFGAVLVAQHMPAQFMNSFVSHIQTMTPFPTKIAQKGDMLYSKRILFSPTDSTMEVHRTKKGCITDIVDFKTRLQPDINHSIISCAETFKSSMVLVVLSGLGDDGVKGAEAVKKCGGKVIVEDESTASVYSGMPSSVVKSGFYDLLCPSYKIAEAVECYLSNKPIKQNSKQFMVKGVIIKNAVQTLKNKFSQEKVDKVIAQLSDEGKALLAGGFRQYNYYSSVIYYDLYTKIEKLLSPENPRILEEMGEENALECINAYKTALSLVTLSDFSAFMQGLCKIVFPGILFDQLDINQGGRTLCFSLRSNGFTEENIKLSASLFKGWLACFGKLLNLTLTSSVSEAAKDEKGAKIRCEIQWK
jgi:two-component system chemotaxis response regulator CheB